MNKKAIIAVICIYVFFYILNYLTPMSFGDDYVYSFVWQGHSEYEPLTETAKRVSSLQDLLISQWSHYLTWSGRSVSHTIAQFFLWMGKDIFNIFNSLISVFLVMEIYWCANKGIVTFDFKVTWLFFIFFALWAFTPAFSSVFFWLTGACNYLWPGVFLLGFLLPFVRKYYFFDEIVAKSSWFKFLMFFAGIIAGWSNENSICWIILCLLFFIVANRKQNEIETWMFSGLAGLTIGYALLMLAPGNVARLHAETGNSFRLFAHVLGLIKTHVDMLTVILCFQFLLWYFSLRSLFVLRIKTQNSEAVKKESVFIQTLCLLSFCMTALMIFSPNFPPRSAFPGTILIIVATTLLLRYQNESSIIFIRKNTKIILGIVGSVYFLISSTATLYSFYDYHVQIQKILSLVKQSEQAKEQVIVVPSLAPVRGTVANMTGFRLLYYEMSDTENDWRNVAFSRYYGIKGIRMIKPGSQKQE